MSRKIPQPRRTFSFSSGHPPITLDVRSPKPISSPEIEQGLTEFKDLLRNRWPMKRGRTRIRVGDNSVSVVTAMEEALSAEQLENALEDMKDFFKRFPHKPDKIDIYEDLVE